MQKPSYAAEDSVRFSRLDTCPTMRNCGSIESLKFRSERSVTADLSASSFRDSPSLKNSVNLGDELRVLQNNSFDTEIVRQPRRIEVQKIVEVPSVEYREVLVEKIVEVPEYEDEVLIHEIPINEYVEVPVHVEEIVENPQTFNRQVPIPVELVCEWRFKLPSLNAVQRETETPVLVPRFIEVPVPSIFYSEDELEHAKTLHNKIVSLMSMPNVSVAEMSALAEIIMKSSELIRDSESASSINAVEASIRAKLEGVRSLETTTLPVTI